MTRSFLLVLNQTFRGRPAITFIITAVNIGNVHMQEERVGLSQDLAEALLLDYTL